MKFIGPIHTGGCGGGNYIYAEVELADWDDVEEGWESICSAVIETEDEDEE